MRVLICGAGALGTTLAYFLSRRGAEPVVVERSEVGGAASGKSGGFLALDWCDGSALEPLARRSYALHAELAAEHAKDGEAPWGYRPVETLQVIAGHWHRAESYRRQETPDWLAESAVVAARLGDPRSTAQIDPAAYTRGMLALAEARGAWLVTGTVTGLEASADGSALRALRVDGETLEGDAVAIALGPWSALACDWLPLPACGGLKGHSLVFRYRPPGPPRTLFVAHAGADGGRDDPEVVPRADGTTYICGLRSEAALPLDPAEVGPDPGAHERLRTIAAEIAPALGAAEILARGACYRPITQDGLPLLGRVPGVEGAYVATGHSVWGMLNAPASAEALAELILDGAPSRIDLTPYDPARLPPARLKFPTQAGIS